MNHWFLPRKYTQKKRKNPCVEQENKQKENIRIQKMGKCI